MRRIRLAALAMALLALCATPASAATDARVRVVHASPDAPGVDVIVNDAPQVLLAGTDTVALAIPGLFLRRGMTYAAVAAGLAGGTPGLTVLLREDARGFNPASFLRRFRR